MQNQNQNSPSHPALRKTWEDLQSSSRSGILSSAQMTRLQRERLTKAGFLDPVMRGWYRLVPNEPNSASIAPILDFLPIYLDDRLGDRWCLSAESSLLVRFAPGTNPGRLVVMADFGSTTVHTFDDGFRLTIYQDDQQLPTRLENRNGFRVMPLEMILARLTLAQWERHLPLVDKAIIKISNWEALTWQLLSEERYQSTTRLALRLKELGMTKPAATVLQGLQAAGISPSNPESPTKEPEITLEMAKPTASPATDLSFPEIWTHWSNKLPEPDFTPSPNTENLIHRLSTIEFAIPQDVLHHLALSGHEIPMSAIIKDISAPEMAANAAGWPTLSPEERNPNADEQLPLPGEIDPQALVALQGYLEAIRLVKRSVVRLMDGMDTQRILRQDLRGWRLALMGPSAEAGLISRRQVLRFRDDDPTLDLKLDMDLWSEHVAQCDPAHHRGLLSFLGIMHLKPWHTGNLRLALLVMNALNASAGLPWVIIKQSDSKEFFEALKSAQQDLDPTALCALFKNSWII